MSSSFSSFTRSLTISSDFSSFTRSSTFSTFTTSSISLCSLSVLLLVFFLTLHFGPISKLIQFQFKHFSEKLSLEQPGS